jgi:hypothetical protein
MPYTFARIPAVIDKTKNTPGKDTSVLTKDLRIKTVGSFVSSNGVLSSVKKAMQAAKANHYGNEGNFIAVSKHNNTTL